MGEFVSNEPDIVRCLQEVCAIRIGEHGEVASFLFGVAGHKDLRITLAGIGYSSAVGKEVDGIRSGGEDLRELLRRKLQSQVSEGGSVLLSWGFMEPPGSQSETIRGNAFV